MSDEIIKTIRSDDPLGDPFFRALVEKLRAGGVGASDPRDVRRVVADIFETVRTKKDQGLLELTKRLDGAELSPDRLRVSDQDIRRAHEQADADFLALMRRAIRNIREYQESIKVVAPPPLRRGGRELAVRYTPIDRVGVYVPGGRALYPSTVLMTAVPAQVAGVKDIALVSPPTTDGDIHPMVLALAGELGVKEVYRVGGAQAVAALAMGTQTIAPVRKIVGPGNAYVAEAKRRATGLVGIDSIAGPSEVLILADDSARADWVAADMLAQAEHNPGSAILVTTSESLAGQVVEQIPQHIGVLERSDAIRSALREYSAILVVPDIDTACAVANEIAAEHLQILTRDDEKVLKKIRDAGAIFLGPYTPVPVGDYYAGPSHVLPTGGTAKFYGPLSVNDFLKSTSLLRYDAAALREDAEDIMDFATREGLSAHAESVRTRRNA
ncbi:MAG: histidinol dehydrogenase [Phycisphaerae bacterium]|nr:histidinol dehydrogenase [Phycisphaerae bacterium]